MKRTIDTIIDWERDRTNESRLSASVTRNGKTAAYQGVSQASIERLGRCVDELRPRGVWGGGSYWGGRYEIEEKR